MTTENRTAWARYRAGARRRSDRRLAAVQAVADTYRDTLQLGAFTRFA